MVELLQNAHLADNTDIDSLLFVGALVEFFYGHNLLSVDILGPVDTPVAA